MEVKKFWSPIFFITNILRTYKLSLPWKMKSLVHKVFSGFNFKTNLGEFIKFCGQLRKPELYRSIKIKMQLQKGFDSISASNILTGICKNLNRGRCGRGSSVGVT